MKIRSVPLPTATRAAGAAAILLGLALLAGCDDRRVPTAAAPGSAGGSATTAPSSEPRGTPAPAETSAPSTSAAPAPTTPAPTSPAAPTTSAAPTSPAAPAPAPSGDGAAAGTSVAANTAGGSPPAGGSGSAGGGAAPYKVVDGNKVDAKTMDGFRAWRAAACDRCHGANQEGMVGPSLIESLKKLSYEDFKTTLLEGRLQKGMPSFKTNEMVVKNMEGLYGYLKGRSDGAITSAKVQPIE